MYGSHGIARLCLICSSPRTFLNGAERVGMQKLGVDPTVDFAFRKLFGDPRNSDILIDLLNSVLQPVAPITSVEVLNPFLDKAYADDKLSILDIKARDEAGRWINVEMQTTI